MKSYCVRQGQIEVGIIEHEGRTFSALGATVDGRQITAYTRRVHGDIQLSTWCGATILAGRSEIVERFWTGSLALIFRLTRGRFIVGYALGEDGMLFRGEFIQGCSDEHARHDALMIANCFAELDAEDDEEFVPSGNDELTPT